MSVSVNEVVVNCFGENRMTTAKGKKKNLRGGKKNYEVDVG